LLRRPSLRQVAISVALGEAALLLGLAVYLVASGRALVIAFPPRESVRVEPSPRLIIPVAGVRAAELRDSYGAARSGGRAHKGVDIFAARGTPVLAAAAGVIVKRDSSGAGGISIYERDLDGRTIYYYAHLNGWRAGLKEGDLVRQGDVIGYVGQTGNVSGNPHLHFAVFTVEDPNRWWRGRDLNPYSLLRDGDANGSRRRP
jgi:murein DD-endopeptidase MepM/ murein hydrolase activator NlpD